MVIYKSSHRRCSLRKGVLRNFKKLSPGGFCKKGVLRHFAKFTGKQFRPATLLKKSPWHRCFPVNLAKFLRTSFFTEHLRCLPLNFVKVTGKYLCQSLYFSKVRPATLSKQRLWHRCFPMNFTKFIRTPFLQNTSGRLLLNITRYFMHLA